MYDPPSRNGRSGKAGKVLDRLKQDYLKFDLSSITGFVTDAELRMSRFGGSRPEEISAYLITDDSWTEAALTGVNRPAPVSPPNGTALGTGLVAGSYDVWQ